MNKKYFVIVILILILSSALSSCKEETITETHETPKPTLNPGINNLTMLHNGLERSLIVQLPPAFQRDKVYPIVFYFHGLNGKKENSQLIFGPIVETENIIGVFPQGHLGSWNDGGNESPSSKADDVGFTLYILEKLKQMVNIDENRIYSLGYSNGGAFSYYLAFQTNKFASIASLAASFFINTIIPSTTRKTPLIIINGELDPVVPWNGGSSSYLPFTFISALNTAKAWAIHNGLTEEPVVTGTSDNLTLYTFRSSGDPNEVRLYKLRQTTHDIGTHPYIYSGQCNRDIWEFFKQHPKVASN